MLQPATEFQARPLAKIKDLDQEREAWQNAVSTTPEKGHGCGDSSIWGIVGSHDRVNHKRGLA